MTEFDRILDQFQKTCPQTLPGARVEGCPCCSGRDFDLTSALSVVSRDELSADYYRRYLGSAMNTLGTEEQFLYFLPAMLRKASAHHSFLHDLVFKLHIQTNLILSADQQSLLVRLMRLLVRKALDDHQAWENLFFWYHDQSIAYWDILDELLAHTSPFAQGLRDSLTWTWMVEYPSLYLDGKAPAPILRFLLDDRLVLSPSGSRTLFFVDIENLKTWLEWVRQAHAAASKP